MNEEARRWLAQADEDLRTAEILFASQRYGPCAFFCQQAAEKGLEAVLRQVGERPWGHSVSSLLDQICMALKIDPVDAPQGAAQALDEHYMRPRYPDARLEVEGEYEEETAYAALLDVGSVLSFARKGIADVRTDTDG